MSESLLKQITDMRLRGSQLRRVPRSQIKDRSRAVIPKLKPARELPEPPAASAYTGLPEPCYEFRDYSGKAPKQHFECPTCARLFSVKNVPKVLECGESVCQECIVETVGGLAKEVDEFHCRACGECHAVPEFRVFKNNKFLLKLLKLPYFPAIPKDPEVLAVKEEMGKLPVTVAELTPEPVETSVPESEQSFVTEKVTTTIMF